MDTLLTQAEPILEPAAAAHPDSAEPTPAAVAPQEPDPASVRVKGANDTAQAAETPVVAEGPKTFKLGDEDLVEILVDGETQLVPWKQARSGASGEFKFTRSMQQLAAEKKALAEQQQAVTQTTSELQKLQTERQQVIGFLQDREQIANFIRARYPDMLTPDQVKQAVNGPDLNEIATVGDVRTVAHQEMAALQAQIASVQDGLQKQLADNERQIQSKAEAKAFAEQQAGHVQAITSTLNEIFTEHPVLKSPAQERALRLTVKEMIGPETTEAEALQMFRHAAAEQVRDIEQHTKATQKLQKIAEHKQRLESRQIEPAGGTAPQQAPVNHKNADGTLNWKSVQQAALNFSN